MFWTLSDLYQKNRSLIKEMSCLFGSFFIITLINHGTKKNNNINNMTSSGKLKYIKSFTKTLKVRRAFNQMKRYSEVYKAARIIKRYLIKYYHGYFIL